MSKIWAAASAELDDVQLLPGYCSHEKAVWLHKLVTDSRPASIAEVGVFGGRSLLPMALALRDMGGGIVYGVDQWIPLVKNENLSKYCHTNPTWSSSDLLAAYGSLLTAIVAHQVWPHVRVQWGQSTEVAQLHSARSIDLLHLDGSHEPGDSCADWSAWRSRLRPGALVVVDDTDWESVQFSLRIIERSCDLVADYTQYRLYQYRPHSRVF